MEKEKLMEIHKQFKRTIYMLDGSLIPVISTKRTICNVHLMLAHEVVDNVSDESAKQRMLKLIEEVYDMGKRMDRGLAEYRKILGLDKSEGRKREREAYLNSVDEDDFVIP